MVPAIESYMASLDAAMLASSTGGDTQAALTTEGEGLVVAYHYGRGEKAPLPDELRRRIEALEGGRQAGAAGGE